MFCTDISAPFFLIFSSSAPQLLYYSHIPTMAIALFFGFFVFLKNKTIASKILFALSIAFSLWVSIDLIAWVNIDSRLVMFAWSFFGILYTLIFLLSLYFVYVFIDKKDVSFLLKVIFGILLLPVLVLTPTSFNLSGFDLANCEATEGNLFVFSYHLIGFVIAIWILILAFLRLRKAEADFKKQIILLTIGIELFLFSFFLTGFLASYFVSIGLISDFGLEFYGLLSMAVFMGFLAYLIVRYKAFEIKLLGAQVLVVSLVVLIGSQFFFIRNNTNKILTGVTLALAVGFGYILIKSVKDEIKRKEDLQTMADKLAHANDELHVLDNAKSEFISIASHQLRTPLTAIKGFVSLILEDSYGKVNQEVRDALAKVYISNERLIELVEDMLSLSRIEAGRMVYDFEKVDLAEVCKEVFDTFVIRAKDKKLDFDLKLLKTPLKLVTTDKGKIREVISNLVDNALKYTLKGGVKIRLSETEKGVIVAVRDTGIGVPEEELLYLFQKFSRGKDVSRLNTGGTGLGLHVGKKMMEALHGKIWVESRGKDMGSNFSIEVPFEVETKEQVSQK